MSPLMAIDGHMVCADDVCAVTRIEHTLKKSFLNDTCLIRASFSIACANGVSLVISREETVRVDDEDIVDTGKNVVSLMLALESLRDKFIAEIGERRRNEK